MVTKKETLVDKIYKDIKYDIIIGYLKPNEKININELAQRYGASLTPLKLALNRLISEKTIISIPRQGMTIKNIDITEIEEIFDIRLMLDLQYTSQIIETVNSNDAIKNKFLDQYDKLLNTAKKLIKNPTVELYAKNFQLDYEFHKTYLECSNNKKIIEIYDRLNPFLYSMYTYRKQSNERFFKGVKEHKKIIDAILEKDEEKLRNIIIENDKNTRDTILLFFKVSKLI